MTEKKIYINEDNKACAICPQCGKVKTIDVLRYGDTDRQVRVGIECICGCSYTVFIERRKYYRKETDLSGVCANFDSMEIREINVKNLSRTGVGFTINSPIPISPGDILKVRFVLNGKKRVIINEEVVVQRINKDYIGAGFRRIKELYPDLGYYLMP